MDPIRKTQIICTLGPASFSTTVLEKLVESGMNLCRLNFSHGNKTWFEDLIRNIRTASVKEGKRIPFLIDLQGGKVRLGYFSRPVFLQTGQNYLLTTKEVLGDENQAQVISDAFLYEIRDGDRIYLDDGKLEMEVLSHDSKEINCRVLSPGWVSSRKGVNCPSMAGSSGTLTKMAEKDLLWGIEQKADFFYLSFVRGPEEVEQAKEFLRGQGVSIPVVAKIENLAAVQHIDEIIQAADGICVARGDLGVEIPLEDLALTQKTIVARCRSRRKPVSVGGQMMMTMVGNPRPLRAEVCDVANAVIDGADALILSDETAVGKYPVQAVETMSRIIQRTEEALTKKLLDFSNL